MKDEEALDSLAEYKRRAELIPYDDGRKWCLLLDSKLKLGTLAVAFEEKDIAFLEKLEEFEKLIVRNSVRDIPGNEFLCILFEDACFLKPYPDEGTISDRV